jgi:hypothetical protein
MTTKFAYTPEIWLDFWRNTHYHRRDYINEVINARIRAFDMFIDKMDSINKALVVIEILSTNNEQLYHKIPAIIDEKVMEKINCILTRCEEGDIILDHLKMVIEN